jgi:hypothetical protein
MIMAAVRFTHTIHCPDLGSTARPPENNPTKTRIAVIPREKTKR